MKRLNLEDFKAKKLTEEPKEKTDLLLGQVLGDCHDGEDDHGVGYYIGYAAGWLVGKILD